MALVAITDVQVLNNPSTFLNPFQFEITFECIRDLREDLEWKITYIGSAESDQYDQILDDILVGPVSAGIKKFVFQAPAPDISKLPDGELLGVTAVLLTCSYRGQEFIRVGYYVNNELPGEENNNNGSAVSSSAAASSTSNMAGVEASPVNAGNVDDDAAAANSGGAGAGEDDDDMDEDENAVVEGIEEDETPAAPKRTGPVNPQLVVRNILASKPRVTRFQIEWDN